MISYIDGFNLYFGLRDSNLRKHLWLDVTRLSESLLIQGQTLVKTKYFTSRISGPPDKRKRQSSYLDALATLPPDRFSAIFGKYQQSPRTCPYCGRTDQVPSEKMTDVNIAVEMLTDAYRDEFDTALLISADSDLCPPITRVRSLFPEKRIIIGFPPRRESQELRKAAHGTFHINHAHVAQSQFPNPVITASGFSLAKPASWDRQS